MSVLIGIAGGTGAGKTALVRELVNRVGGSVLELDAYYVDRTAMPPEARARLNYDEPAAIDDALVLEHLDSLARGEPVAKPVYSFENHARVGHVRMEPARLVIVEGLFTWWWEPVRRRLDLKVFVDAAADVRLSRRLRRDLTERGRNAEHVIHQYLATVRPMHALYVEPCRATADVLIENEGPLDEAVDRVVEALRPVVNRRPLGVPRSSVPAVCRTEPT